jgi:hypothetical protein
VYLLHGTFAGNDALGLYTELERIAPTFAQALRRLTKRAFNAILGETGNYTPQFAARMEQALSVGAGRTIPVRLFNWSSMNHHIGRADAAVRLIDELAAIVNPPAPSPLRGWDQTSTGDPKSPERSAVVLAKQPGRGLDAGTSLNTPPPAPPRQGEGSGRVLLWAHSHGGNALAILTNLLGADDQARQEFFDAARIFHRGGHAGHSGFTAWPRVEQVLADPAHPVRKLQLDIVTFGTPIRYGWDTGGYRNLLHIIHHRPHHPDAEHAPRYPPNPWHVLTGREGDFIQHIGIAGTNLPPLPLALKTFLADRRLGRLLQRDLPKHWLHTRLKQDTRVAHEGTTLLVDYDDPDRSPHRHLFGHAPYTRSRWLALHCELVAEHFYNTVQRPMQPRALPRGNDYNRES